MSTPYQKAAGAKASEAGFVATHILQYGKKPACDEYVNSGTWDAAWGEPKFKKQPKSQNPDQTFDFSTAVVPDMTPAPVEPDQAPELPTNDNEIPVLNTDCPVLMNQEPPPAKEAATRLADTVTYTDTEPTEEPAEMPPHAEEKTLTQLELLHLTATAAHEAGICVNPPKQDGSKRPLGNSDCDNRWKHFQTTRSTATETEQWYSDPNRTGIGFFTGAVSGNLECLDFDEASIYEPFRDACIQSGLGELLTRIEGGYCEASPKGRHLLTRCSEISGSLKLATRPKTEDEKQHDKDNIQVLIETRGEGGYIIAAPSFGTVHPSGKPYTMLSGSVSSVVTITPEERKEIHRIAQTFHVDDPSKIEAEAERLSAAAGTHRPGDDYNQNGPKWKEILTGWELVDSKNDVEYIRRPGKTEGVSGTLGYGGKDCFYCYTTSTIFEAGRVYDKFGAYAAANHNGDLSAAAAALAKLGYGDQNKSSNKGVDPTVTGWEPPRSLGVKSSSEPYPFDSLPDGIRLAVAEVQSFVQAPIPLVAASALGAVSLACQAHIDVKRAERLTGPTSLNLIGMYDSGERKTTCDNFFMGAINQYDADQEKLGKPLVKKHLAELEAWESTKEGIKDKIRTLAKAEKDTTILEEKLRGHELKKPEPPKIPHLVYADSTTEDLRYSLAYKWPSGGIVTSEGGIIFGSHAMEKKKMTQNLATLDLFWDGKDVPVGRRTSESFTVRNARLTISIQTQPSVFTQFADENGGLARGIGFFARCLVHEAESTQGSRPFKDAPADWPHLTWFNNRISTILAKELSLADDGTLNPLMLPFAPDAKQHWIGFHDAVESMLASGKELYDVRDVASKTADNAARLAALFQYFSSGGDAISLENIKAASQIAAWHLSESRRIFGELVLPVEMANASKLDDWILSYCKREQINKLSTKTVQQYGPSKLRDKKNLNPAIEELESLDRIYLKTEGKQKIIYVNPELLGGTAQFSPVQPATAIPAIVATFENIQTGAPVAEVATIAVATPTGNLTENVYELDSSQPIPKDRGICKLADLCTGSRDILPDP